MIVMLLSVISALGLGYVVGRVHEGCRVGGTIDLATQIALATEVAQARAHRQARR